MNAYVGGDGWVRYSNTGSWCNTRTATLILPLSKTHYCKMYCIQFSSVCLFVCLFARSQSPPKAPEETLPNVQGLRRMSWKVSSMGQNCPSCCSFRVTLQFPGFASRPPLLIFIPFVFRLECKFKFDSLSFNDRKLCVVIAMCYLLLQYSALNSLAYYSTE